MRERVSIILGIILICIALLFSIFIFSLEIQARVRRDRAYDDFISQELSVDEYQDKLYKIEKDYLFLYDLSLWRNIFLPLGTIFAIFGMYSYIRKFKNELDLKKEIKPDEFHYSYSQLPLNKKKEKLEKMKK
jgi:hypothetical protein